MIPAQSESQSHEPQVQEWVQNLLQLSDERLLSYFSEWSGWSLGPLSDMMQVKPVLDRVAQLLQAELAAERLGSVGVLLNSLLKLQRSVASRNLHFMAEALSLVLDLDDWDLVLKALSLLQVSSTRASRLFRPHRTLELSHIAYKLYTLAMGANVNNNHTFTFQEMHAAEAAAGFTYFTYHLGDQSAQLSTEDPEPELKPELLYAFRCRRRFARTRACKEVMLAQLLSVAGLLKIQDPLYMQELWKSYPELWLLPSLVALLRDASLPPVFHKQIIEVMRAMLNSADPVSESPREREVASCLQSTLAPAHTHGLLQTLLRDAITGTPGLLPQRTCDDQGFLKSILALVDTIAQRKQRSDTAHIPGLVSLLIQMLVQPSALRFKPRRLAKASQVLCILIAHSIVMFKELDGLQVTLDLLQLHMAAALEDSTGSESRKDLIRALFQLIETALKVWDQQPGMINNQISKIATSSLIGQMQAVFQTRRYHIFDPCLSLLSLMMDEQPALPGDLAQKGLLLVLFTAMEECAKPIPTLVQTFSRFLCKVSVHRDGISLMETSSVVDCILRTLRSMEMGGSRSEIALEIASNLKEISLRVPSIRLKIMDSCIRTLTNLKATAKELSREEFFAQLSSISFLLSNLLHLSEDMIEMFIQSEGLDLFFSLFKLPILPVSLDSEVQYAVTCFQNLNASQFSLIFRKVVDSIAELTVKLEQLLGPLRNAECLSKITPLEELTGLSPDEQVTVTLTSLTSFIEMAVWLLRFTGGSADASSDMVNVIASLGQLFRLVVYEETLLDQARALRSAEMGEGQLPDPIRCKLISIAVTSLQNLLKYGTSIGAGRSKPNDENLLNLLVCASETLCALTSSIQLPTVTPLSLAFANKLLTNLMKILFHKYSSALSLVAFHNGEGTKSITSFIHQLKATTYEARAQPDNPNSQALEQLWSTSGQFFESLATWEYAIRTSMSNMLKNFGVDDVRHVTRMFQTAVLDAMEELDYKDCSELSTGFMKNILEVIRVLVDELKDTAAADMSVVTPLMEMGFSEMRVRQALQQVKGSSLEAAMEWLLTHADLPEDLTFQEHDWQDALGERLKGLGDVLVRVLSVNPELSASVSNLILLLAKKNGEMMRSVTSQLVQLSTQQLTSLSQDLFSLAAPSSVSVLSVLQQLSILSQKSSEVLDILVKSQFNVQLSHTLGLIASDLRISDAHPLILEPVLTLLNSMLKYSGKPEEGLVRGLSALLKTNASAPQTLINSEGSLVALLALLGTVTSDLDQAEAFLAEEGLYHVFVMKTVQMEVQSKVVLPLLVALCLQLVEDPYILEATFSVDILTQVTASSTLESLLKAQKKNIKRSKTVFLKAFQSVCEVVKTATKGLKVQPKAGEVEINAKRWNGVSQLVKAEADLYEAEQIGKPGNVFGSELVLGMLGEALQQFPLLIETLLEERLELFDRLQGTKVLGTFISHIVRSIIPYRYALRHQQGNLFYTYPSSSSLVPPAVLDVWVKSVAKLVRSLCFRQNAKGKAGSAAAALHFNLLLRQNKPCLRARKWICKELKEMLAEVIREEWFGSEQLMSQLKACLLMIMQLLKEAPRSAFVSSSPAEIARALTSDQGAFLNMLCEAAKGVKLTIRKSTSLLSAILAPLELLTRYGITFALRSVKQPLDTEVMIEDPVENQEPMQLQEEPNSEMVMESEEDQERPRMIEEEADSQDYEGEEDMMSLMMIEGRHGEWEEMEEPPRFHSGMQRMDMPEVASYRAPPPFYFHPRSYAPERFLYDRTGLARGMDEREEELMHYLSSLRYDTQRYRLGGPPGAFGRFEDGESFEEILQNLRQRRHRDRQPSSAPAPQSDYDEVVKEITIICVSLAVPEPVQPAPVEEPSAIEQPPVPPAVASPPVQPEVDPAFLEALPEQIRNEVLQTMRATAPGQLNEDVMSELPAEIQEELRQEQSRQQRMAESMDNATMVAMLAPDIRRDVLLTASEDFLNSLSEDQIAEAQLLRERLHRVIGEDRQPASKPPDERKDVAEIVSDDRLCELLIQPSDSFLDLLFRALYLVNPVNKDVLESLFLNLSAQPVARAKIMQGLLVLLKALEPRSDFPPQHLLGSESFVENYQQVYAVVAGRILEILKLLTKRNPKASLHFIQSTTRQLTPLIAATAAGDENRFNSLISLMSSRLYQSSANHLLPLLSVLLEIIEREAQPPALDAGALSQVCSMLSFESLGENGVTIVVDIIHKLSNNPENRLLVEPAVTSDIISLKSQLISILSTNLASTNIQKQVQLLRLCKVVKNINPEARLVELEELWTHLSCAFKALADSEGEGTGLSAVLTRLLPLVETFFVAHSDSSPEEVTNFFSDRNKKMLNLLVKQNPALLESTLLLLTQRFYFLLDFENKREYFKSQTKKYHVHRSDTIRLKIHRNNIFIDSFHKLKNRPPNEMYGRLQVDFIGEEGLDLGGPTREWYSALSREMFNPDYALFVLAANGVSFQPNSRSYVNSEHLDFFRFVGKIIGKALVDGVNLEVHFTRSFYKHILGQPVTVQDMEDLDPEIYKSLQQLLSIDLDSTDLFEDYFTYEEEHFGNMVTKELVPNGKSIRVTEANKADYVQRLCNMKMTDGIRAQIEAFLEGLYSLVKKEFLAIFDAKELELLIAGLHEISVDDLRDNTEYQGYAPDSPLITWFWEVLEEFSNEQRAQLLQFVTGSSKVPLEGFKALRGNSGVQLFQIHKSFASTERLPTAHTW